MWLKLMVMKKNLIKSIHDYKIRNNTVAKEKVDGKEWIPLDNAKGFSSRCRGGLGVQGQRREAMGSDIYTVELSAPSAASLPAHGTPLKRRPSAGLRFAPAVNGSGLADLSIRWQLLNAGMALPTPPHTGTLP